MEKIQVRIDAIAQAEKNLMRYINEDIYGLLTQTYEEIQLVRCGRIYKAMLYLRVLAGRVYHRDFAQVGRMLKYMVKRNTVELETLLQTHDIFSRILEVIGKNRNEMHGFIKQAAQQQQAAVLELIDEYHCAGRRVIMVMAPYFTHERLADGYFQRVQAVDQMFDADDLKIYASWLEADQKHGQIHCKIWDSSHVEITYLHPNEDCDARILQLAQYVDVVYHHSITFANEAVTKHAAIQKIFDMHGAYPEELRLYGREQQAEIDEHQEMLAMTHGQCVVCVTKSMREHLARKYIHIPDKVIYMPILSKYDAAKGYNIKKPDNERYTIVYAGGLQKWQCVGQMQELIFRTQDRFEYKFLTPQPQEFWEQWKYTERPKHLTVCSKLPQDIFGAYESCHFGLLLREDSVINYVACPTKLVEYLAAGIVPILNTTFVGDFVSDGMQYVTVDDVIEGNLPSFREREAMARNNLDVLDVLLTRNREGEQQIKDWINEISRH